MLRLSFVIFVMFLSTALQAQDASPLPAIPDLSAPVKDLGDERKFFVFHKDGVSMDDARRDFAECLRHVERGTQLEAPAFVPWEDAVAARSQNYNPGYGLVGLVIASIIEGPLERSLRQMTMMRCMMPRGYRRYRVTENMWKKIHEGDDPQASFEMQVAIAIGATPPTPEITS